MADGTFPGLVSRNRELNSSSNVIFTQIADDSGNVVTVTGGKLDVNATVTLETAYADESAFTIGTDKVNAQGYLVDETAPDSAPEGSIALARMTADRKILTVITDGTTDGNRLAIDASGYITSNINGTVTVDATDLDIRDLTHVSDSVRLGDGTTLTDVLAGTNNALYVALTDGTNTVSVDASGYLTVNVNGTVTVTATDLDIRDLSASQDNVAISDGTDTLAINTDGSINVQVVEAPITGEVHDYDTAAAVASDATSNHDYTVANTTFLLKSVIVAGSGNIKFEIQTGPLASLATVAVGFLTGRQGDTKQVVFDPPIEVPVASTGTVRVIRTNRQGAATDVYSTIIGIDQ